MNKFMLNITASSGEFYQGDCETSCCPPATACTACRPGTTPCWWPSTWASCTLKWTAKARDILVGDGIAEVTPAYVMVLVDSAERPEDIDKNRAEAARIRAEERLQHKQSMHEYYQSKIALDRAMQRLQTAAKYKRGRRENFEYPQKRHGGAATHPAGLCSIHCPVYLQHHPAGAERSP